MSGPLFSLAVVISHVLGDAQQQLFKRSARPVVEFVFQVPEERLDRRVVDAAAFSGHRLDHLAVPHQFNVSGMRVVEALVGVDHRIRACIGRQVPDRVHDQFHFEAGSRVPRNDFAACDILDDRKIHELPLEWYVGDIGTENGSRGRLAEGALQLVGEYPVLQPLLHHGLVRIPSSHAGNKPIRSHKALYFLVIHLGKSHFHASPAVYALPAVKDRLDLEVVGVVSVRLIGMQKPSVVPASRHVRQLAENSDIVFQFSDEPVFLARPEFDSALLARSLAKKSFSA